LGSNISPKDISISWAGKESVVVSTLVEVRPIVFVLVPPLEVEPLRSTRVGLDGKQQVLDALERDIWNIGNHQISFGWLQYIIPPLSTFCTPKDS
jgi:hypothetical protein